MFVGEAASSDYLRLSARHVTIGSDARKMEALPFPHDCPQVAVQRLYRMLLKLLASADLMKGVTVDALIQSVTSPKASSGASHKCVEALRGMYDGAWLFVIVRSWFPSI